MRGLNERVRHRLYRCHDDDSDILCRMDAKLAIRPFRASDRDAMVDLWDRCGLRVSHNDPHKDIERKLAEQPDLFLVGESSGSIVACCMCGYEGHRGSIYYLGTHPDYQGRGFGRAIMQEAERLLMARGCPKINLMARESNAGVIGFYERLGYAREPVVVMGKRLIPDV